jgi:hypothetical protein
MDLDIQRAIEDGKQNLEAKEFIQNWCRHARVEKFGGTGLIEMQTGLPIGRGSVPQGETADALHVLTPLCNLAGRAVQDAEFNGLWTEAEFQRHVRAELRRHPLIGSDLDEHAHGGGGITDLSLRGVPIELKVLKALVTSIDDCSPFLAQAASYAVAKSKRTAILCVLDTSKKTTPPMPAERLLGIELEPTSGVAVCVLVIQGNLARPSALSR